MSDVEEAWEPACLLSRCVIGIHPLHRGEVLAWCASMVGGPVLEAARVVINNLEKAELQRQAEAEAKEAAGEQSSEEAERAANRRAEDEAAVQTPETRAEARRQAFLQTQPTLASS